MSYIYKTTNKINGKIYIGLSKRSPKESTTYLGSGVKIRKAIEEFGIENFEKMILEELENEENLDEREIYWIEFFNSTNPEIGYNITSGGGGWHMKGVKRSEENKEKLRKSNTGKKHTEETKRKISESNKGKSAWNKGKKTGIKLSDEHKEKLHSSRRNVPSWNAGISGCYQRSEETKKKLSDLHKGKPKSQEHREKISKALKGKKSTSLYDKWINKYGKEIADEKMKAYKEKQSISKRKK